MMVLVMTDWWMIWFVRQREFKGPISLDEIFKINIINSYGML
jgi:hypothetical protein